MAETYATAQGAFPGMMAFSAADIAAGTGAGTARRDVLSIAREKLEQLRAQVAPKVTGTFVRPDSKELCPVGPDGDSVGHGKAHEWDPNNCLMHGGPWLRPLLERDIDCSNAGTDLVWGPEIAEAQRVLMGLAAGPPAMSATPETKVRYVEAVMGLAQILLQGCNISPWFLGMTPESIRLVDDGRDYRIDPVDPEWGPLLRRPEELGSLRGAKINADGLRYGDGLAPATFEQFQGDWTAPLVQPPFFAAVRGLGWAPWIGDNSLHSRIVRGSVQPFERGWFAPNSGFTGGIRGFDPGQSWQWRTHRLPLPQGTIEEKAGGDPTQSLVEWMVADPRARLLAIARATNDLPWNRQTTGWSWDRIFRVWGAGIYSAPEPARTIDTVRRCRPYGINYHVEMARRWASTLSRTRWHEVVLDSALAYLKRAKWAVTELGNRGFALDIKPTDVQAAMLAVEQAKREGQAATINAASQIVGGSGGIIGAILQIVAAICTLGYLDFVQSGKSPSRYDGYNLLIHPLALRSPPRSSPCSFNPEAEGGGARIILGLTPAALGGRGHLWDVVQGRNPPPDAPERLQGMTRDQLDLLLRGLLAQEGGSTKKRNTLLYAAGGAGAVLLGAALYKKYRG